MRPTPSRPRACGRCRPTSRASTLSRRQPSPGRRGSRFQVCGRPAPFGDTVIARITRSAVLYESACAPRWYVPREDIQEKVLTPVGGQTFCPHKALTGYYDSGESRKAAWFYHEGLHRGRAGRRPGPLRARQGGGLPRR
ncbi:DUF427 domain-containing protein [Streptomyces sp. NBC_00154]|uniref:DUF427 domain-containing protein n=1 Tax=Streptomyces sp. NBC_00154 TaxID=2975670 RepID=UPI0022514E33|nr:DUF427 domain-containing protein [Streptomyces sp. NBC_00154]MCX5315553.1 DUF427 domain-containing protein [Streptomyces sp. NBC_00154]